MSTDSKYLPLQNHLRQSGQNELTLTLDQIEKLLGEPLPSSARSQRAWWGNRRTGAVQATAWMQAGYHVEQIDLANEQISFRKPGRIYNVQRTNDSVLWDADLIKALRHHMDWTQAELADRLSMRQQTISEWETGMYAPKRSTSKFLTMIAEQAGFSYGQEESEPKDSPKS